METEKLGLSPTRTSITYSLSESDLLSFAKAVATETAENILENKSLKKETSGELLKIPQVMALLQVSRVTLHEWGRVGKLNPIKMGYSVRYERKEIERFLKEGNRK